MTGIQPYGAFVETPDHTEGLIHISEIMDDYVHNLKKFLSEGQVVKAKILSIDDEGKLNLSLKDNDQNVQFTMTKRLSIRANM